MSDKLQQIHAATGRIHHKEMSNDLKQCKKKKKKMWTTRGEALMDGEEQ